MVKIAQCLVPFRWPFKLTGQIPVDKGVHICMRDILPKNVSGGISATCCKVLCSVNAFIAELVR
jgi:hypothetical protein